MRKKSDEQELWDLNSRKITKRMWFVKWLFDEKEVSLDSIVPIRIFGRGYFWMAIDEANMIWTQKTILKTEW